MSGRVSSSYGSWSGTGAEQRYVPVDQTTCCFLSLSEDRGGMLFAIVCAGFIRLCYGVGGERRCLGTLGAPGGSGHLRSISLYVSYAGVPFAGHALRVGFGEGTVFVVL